MGKKDNSAPGSALKGDNGAPISVEQLPIDAIKAYEKHARSHPAAQIAKITASIREFGFVVPVLIDKGNVIIAGHACVLAAKEAGLRLIPCIRTEHLSDAQVKALRLHLNRVAQEGQWLDDILKDELAALQELDFDLSLTGFDDREIQSLLVDDAELARAEETPAIPENPVTVKGDCWLLGKHRLVCGDSTNADDVDKALNGVKPHLCCTDPPYGIEYNADWRNHAADLNLSKKGVMGKGGRAIGKVENDDKADWREAYALFPGDVLYVWHAGTKSQEVAESLVASGFDVRAQIIWAKSNIVVGRGHYHPQHEPLYYAVRKKQGATGHWQGDRTQSTLWKIDKPQKSETGHSTQKPVECMRRPILNNSSPGQAVYEPFSGSGTTIIAGEMTDRSVHAIELSEAYVDVGVLRWQEFAHGQATLEGDGRTFDEIKAERHKEKAAA